MPTVREAIVQRDEQIKMLKTNLLNLEGMEQENFFLKVDLNNQMRKVKALKKQVESLENEIHEAIDTAAKKPKIRLVVVDSDKNLRANLVESTEQNYFLKKEVEGLYSNLSKKESEVKELEEKIDEQKFTIDEEKATIDMSDQIMVEYSNQVQSLEDEIELLKMENSKLRGQVMSKDITINSFTDNDNKVRPIIVFGEEADLYPGEHKDTVISYLRDKLKSLEPYTRQYAIVKSILEANPENGSRAKLKKDLMNSLREFKGAESLTKQQKADLKEYGFEVIPGSNHYKFIFKHRDEYTISVACTPTPSKHAGPNLVSDIIKMVL